MNAPSSTSPYSPATSCDSDDTMPTSPVNLLLDYKQQTLIPPIVGFRPYAQQPTTSYTHYSFHHTPFYNRSANDSNSTRLSYPIIIN